MLIRRLTVGMVQTNCYFLGDEGSKKAAVIDPGDNGGYLAQSLSALGYRAEMVLLTHGHFDHVDGVRDFLAEAGSMPVYLSRKDYPFCPTGFVAPSADGLGELKEVRFLAEGDTLVLGALTIEVLKTPGHTPGGLTFRVGDALFTGDTLFAGSCGRTDFPNSSMEDMLASLRRLGELEGDFQVYPGHMGASTLARERKINPFLRQAMGR